MASSPDTTRQHQAEAAALALLIARAAARYSLPALIAANKIRPRAFRQIRPTNALAADMAAPHFAIVRAWEAAMPDIIAAIPLGQSAVAAAIERAASRIGSTVDQAKAAFPGVLANLERYHRGQWLSRVKASTGLDVSMFTQPSDVADPVKATMSWNAALADDIHHDTKAKVLAFMLAAGITAADAKARAAGVIAKAKTRAAGIGADQTLKASRGMDRARADAAAVTEWTWRHLDPQKHPRPEHQARDGQVFSKDNPPADLPGELPWCHCWGEMKLR